MKKIIALTSIALALTACGSKTVYVVTTDAPDTTVKVTKTTDAPNTTDAPIATAPNTTLTPSWSVEDEFILDIEQGYDDTIYLSDAELIDAGNAVCGALQNGATAYDVLNQIAESSEGDADIELFLTAVSASAIINFCPEQEYKFQN